MAERSSKRAQSSSRQRNRVNVHARSNTVVNTDSLEASDDRSRRTTLRQGSQPYLTVIQLRQQLADRGVNVPANWPRRMLLQLYQENQQRRPVSATVTSSDSYDYDPSVPSDPTPELPPVINVDGQSQCRHPDVLVNLTSVPDTESPDSGENMHSQVVQPVTVFILQRELAELKGLMITMSSQRQVQPDHLNLDLGFQSTQGNGPTEVSSDSLPHIHTVAPALKKRIQDGKYCNLALLLLPNQDIIDARMAEYDGNVYHLKDDWRLNRSLTLSEFIQAFAIYKDIYCENNDAKRKQLDGHEKTVIELATMYGGTSHYDYHKMFAARVAAYAGIQAI